MQVPDAAWIPCCLWRRLSATAPIRPLAWEPPCAVGTALKKAKRLKKKKKEFIGIKIGTVDWGNFPGALNAKF